MTSDVRTRALPSAGRAGRVRTADDAWRAVDHIALTARIAAEADAKVVTPRMPLTGAPLAPLRQSTPDDVAAAVDRARRAQHAWARVAVSARATVLRRVYDLVLERREQAVDLVQLESGKARAHAYEELADVALNASWYARRGPGLLADVTHPALTPGLGTVREIRHPRGVVGIIAPWNYPLALAVSDALPALLAGNAVVLKPDTQTALTALWAAQLLADAGLPDDLFTVVVGDGPVVGPALIDHVDSVCFTGSTATGRQVGQAAAGRLIGASLELGGKNSLYVADDADLDRAAEAAVRDCFTSAGQLCVSMERLVLHDAIADAFLDRFLRRVAELRPGVALDYSTDLGCLVSDAQMRRVAAHVDDAVRRGAIVLAGGHALPDLGPRFYAPTVLDSVPSDADCYAEETFGPVVSVSRVASDVAALALINDTVYGLTGSVWTRDADRGMAIARRMRTGTVNINEAYLASWAALAAPMGGRGQSGLGRRHGAAGLLRFTESQTIARQRVGFYRLYGLGGRRAMGTLTAALRGARRLHLPWP